MATDPLVLQIVGGALLSGAALLVARSVIRSWERSRSDASRKGAVPFLRSAEQRNEDSDRRARLALERLVKLDRTLPPVLPQAGRGDIPAPDPSPDIPVPAKAIETPVAEIVARVLAAAPPDARSAERLTTIPERQGQDSISGLSRVFIREAEEPVAPSTYAPPTGRGTAIDNDALAGFSLRSPREGGSPRAPSTIQEPPVRPAEQVRNAPERAVWIAPGTEITIRHTRITGGMIYVGESLPSPKGWGADNALVNPSLTIARKYQPGDETGAYHSPEYAHLTSAGRRAYIDWLAGSRSDPQADINLVILYLYGLERRLFHDREMSEAPMLVAEVERLLGVYGSNGAFRNHATNFLAAAALLRGQTPGRIEPSPATDWQSEIPLATLLHLGTVLAEGRPLDADDALLWVLGTPEARLRTPGHRCFLELRQVFAARFAESHSRGLAIRIPKRRIAAAYRAASGSFTSAIPGPHENLPDISGISAPLGELRDLLEASQTDLEAYSRLLGRRPEARGSLEAAMLLPTPLRETATASAAEETRKALLPLLGGRPMTTIAPRTLFGALGIVLGEDAKRPPAAALAQLTQRLDALGFGMEPDRRYGGEAVTTASDMVLFEAPGGAPVDPERPAFVQAKVTAEVAILAAAADGDVSDQELDAVIRDARAIPGLSAPETLRLEAFVWSLRDRAKGGGALRRIAGLPLEARQAIARSAIAAVLSDGQASRTEVAFLERLYRTLGLPPETVHSALHQGTGIDARPSRPAVQATATGGMRPGIALDAERLARIRQETTQVSTLLSGIFAEEQQPDVPPEDEAPVPTPLPAAPARFEGLDGAHGTLLEAVLATGELPMDRFEARAKELRLFPEGAIETINDWAFERYEEPLLETDGDLVIVVGHLRGQLLPT